MSKKSERKENNGRRSLIDRFRKTAVLYPENAAIRDGKRVIRYRELDEISDAIAFHLGRAGVSRGSVVGVSLERSLELSALLLGILKAGACYLPVDPNNPEARRRMILEDAGAAAWVVDDPQTVCRRPTPVARLAVSALMLPLEEEQRPVFPQCDAEDVACIFPTSGTTGRPKGVEVLQKGILRLVIEPNYVDITARDRMAHISNPSFDALSFEIWGALLNGATLVVFREDEVWDLANLAGNLDRKGITLGFFTVTLFNALIAEHPACLRNAKHILVGGEQCNPAMVARFYSANPGTRCLISNAYGPTECTTFAVVHPLAPELFRGKEIPAIVPIGKPINATRVFAVKDGNRLAEAGEEGELYVAGDGLARGYRGLPQETEKRFVFPPWLENGELRVYRTGDRVKQNEDGTFVYLGRIDQQVKIRGFRVELPEIEQCLLEHEKVEQCAVMAERNKRGVKDLHAFIVAAAAPEYAEIRAHLEMKLPPYMVPHRYFLINHIPLTPNGKTDNERLRQMTDREISPSGTGVPAKSGRMEPDRRILPEFMSLCRQALERKTLSADISFVHAGGDSLKAMFLATGIKRLFNASIPPHEILAAPSLAAIVEKILLNRGRRNPYPPVPQRPGGKGPFKASDEQSRMFFLQHVNPASNAYSVPMVFSITGKLDGEVLENALREILQRHASLRTSFEQSPEGVMQRIAPQCPFHLTRHDAVLATGDEVGRLEDAFFGEPFDLGRAPLMRAALVRIGPEQHRLLWNFHHIIADGWSLNLLFDELGDLYRAGGRPSSPTQPQPAADYVQYSLWQEAFFESAAYREKLHFWQERIAEYEKQGRFLPHYASAVRDLKADGRQHRFQVDHETTRQFKALARETNVTLFTALICAYALLLSRYFNRPDIAIGVPVANRALPDFDKTVGMFVNTVVFHFEIDSGKSSAEFLSASHETAALIRAREDAAFGHVTDLIKRPGDQRALFDAMFVLDNTDFNRLDLEGTVVSGDVFRAQKAKFPLTLFISPNRNGLSGLLEYYGSIFDSSTAARAATAFYRIMTAIVEDPNRPIRSLPFLSAAERRLLTVVWNGVQTDYPSGQCAQELFEERAAADPTGTAIRYMSRELDYRQLNQSANRLARHLSAAGFGPGHLAGIAMPRSLEMVVGLLAVLKAGGAYVPLDPEYPARRLEHMIGDSAVAWVLTTRKAAEKLPAGRHKILCLDEPPWNEIPSGCDFENIDKASIRLTSADRAYVIYTSGSTGRPKGVEVTHQGLVNYLAHAGQNYFRHEEEAVVSTSLNFDATVTGLFGPLASGKCVRLLPQDGNEIPHLYAEIFESRRAKVFKLTPAHLTALAEYAARAPLCETGHRFIVGGEQFSTVAARRWKKSLPNAVFVNEYGPTETVVGCSVFTMKNMEELAPAAAAVPIGRPIANMRLHVLSPDLELCPVQTAGELYIGGPGVARGYLNRTELTQKKFITSPFAEDRGARLFRTGDRVRWRTDGQLEFLGRLDEQVKIRGFRVEPGEIEAIISAREGVLSARVFMKPGAGGSERLIAYLAVEKHTAWDSLCRAIRREISESLPSHMTPAAFVRIDRFPLTPNGKVDDSALPAPDFSNQATTIEKNAPDPEKDSGGQDTARVRSADLGEVFLGRIFWDVLGYQIPPSRNIFEAGADSLLLMKVHAKLRESAAPEMNILDFFSHPTISELARHIAGLRREPPERPRAVKAGKGLETGGREIAVIGMAVGLPGADNLKQFWDAIRQNRECIEILNETTHADGDPHFVRARSSLTGIFDFDPGFFGLTKADARLMDPQHRRLLMGAVHALENAGYHPLQCGRPVGVIVCSGENTYQQNLLKAGYKGSDDFRMALHHEKDFLATRIAYHLNLRGPAMTLQTACSSSLAAVHLGCGQLLAGESDMCLVGGIAINPNGLQGYHWRPGHIFSADGHCRPFSREAGGTIGANGYGLAVMKRLADALRDRDRIYAVVQGSAVNNDGRKKVSFTAPSTDGQEEVIRRALKQAGVEAGDVTYVETHGTGTPLGDRIEIEALTRAFRTATSQCGYCAIGSVKSQIGHLGTAAGIAGFIRTALGIYHRILPANPGYTTPSPEIDFTTTPFYVNARPRKWEAQRRLAGVSSFGMGGTNVHVILSQAPEGIGGKPETGDGPYRLLFSAKTREALTDSIDAVRDCLARGDADPGAVAQMLEQTRADYPWRAALHCENRDELLYLLSTVKPELWDPRRQEISLAMPAADRAEGKGADDATAVKYAGEKPWDFPPYPFTLDHYEIETAEPGPQKQPMEHWFHQAVWFRKQRLDRSKTPQGAAVLLVFGDPEHRARSLCAWLRDRGRRVFYVEPGPAFARCGADRFSLRMVEEEDYRSLFREAGIGAEPFDILHFMNVSPRADCFAAADISRAIDSGLVSLTCLLQAYEHVFGGRPMNLSVFSNQAEEVLQGEIIRPEAALVRGVVLTAPAEYPHLAFRQVDLPSADLDDFTDDLGQVALSLPNHPDLCALRHGYLWSKGYASIPAAEKSLSSLSPQAGGVYVLIGGTGGLGRVFIEQFKSVPAVKIVILARSVPAGRPGDQDNPLYLQCDLTDRRQVFDAAQRIRSRFGRITGVVHAAGKAGGGLIRLKKRDAIDRVLAPKVFGSILATEAFADLQPDFIVYCSSLSAIYGIVGQMEYCAANNFQDAWARYQESRADQTVRHISINWPAWKDTGMSAVDYAADTGLARLHRDMQDLAITPEQGQWILGEALKLGLPQLVVSTLNMPEARAFYAAGSKKSKTAPARPAGDAAAGEIRTPIGRLTEIFRRILGVDSIDPQIGFFDLGGDSLLALDLVEEVNRVLNVRLKLNDFITCDSIQELARFLDIPDPDRKTGGAFNPVVLKKGNPNAALFLIHPIGGDVIAYRQLAERIHSDYGIYAIQDPIFNSVSTEHWSIEARAEHYIGAIHNDGLKENLKLAGWSFGGLVAYEMARQLEASGRRGIELFLIDPPLPQTEGAEMSPQDLRAVFLRELTGKYKMPPTEAVDHGSDSETLLQSVLSWNSPGKDRTALKEYLEKVLAACRSNTTAMFRYAPNKKIKAKIHLFLATRAVDGDPFTLQRKANLRMQWQSLARVKIREYPIEGHHYSIMEGQAVCRVGDLINAAWALSQKNDSTALHDAGSSHRSRHKHGKS